MPTLAFDVWYKDRGAERGLKNLGDQTERASKSFGALKIGAAAVGVAVGAGLIKAGQAAVRFGVDSVKAYGEAQQSQVRLQNAFERFPKLADTNIGALQRLNTQLAAKTRFDDDATASGQAVLAQFKLTGTQITELTPLLQDYAAKTGKDLPTAAGVLGKALLGKGRALAAVGINFKDTGTMAGNYDQIIGGLRTQVGGFAEKEGATFAGRIEIIKNRFGEWKEALGGALVPRLEDIAGAAGALMDIAEDLAPDIKALFDAFTGSLDAGSEFKGFTDLIVTNQTDIITGFYDMGESVIGFAQSTSSSITQAIRWFGNLETQIADNLDQIAGFHEVLAGSSFFPPQMRAGFRNVAEGLREQAGKFRESGTRAKEFADTMDGKLTPAMEATRKKAKELRDQAVIRAGQREAAYALSQSIDAVGNSAKLSKEEARKFNGETDTGSKRQKTLAERLVAARDAFLGSYKASDKSRQGQEEFRKAAKKTQGQLETELIKLGLNKELAHKYAKEITEIPTKQSTKASNNMGRDEGPRKAVRNYAKEIRDIPQTWLTKLQYDTSVDGINARLVQKGGRFAVQMSQGSRADLARSPATLAMLGGGHSHGSLPNGFGGPDVTTAGSLAYQRAGQSGVSRALRDGARNSAAGPYGSVTGGGAGRAAGIREGMRWATSGGTYPGHHPSMNKAWDFMATGSAGDRIAGHLWANRARLRLWYLIWNRRIISMTRPSAGWLPYFDGNSSNPNRAHTNHVHASWYDRGGMLRPGGVALNGTSQPERILTGRQTAAFESLVRTVSRTGGAPTIIINAPNYVGSTDDLRRTLVTMAKRGELQVVTR